MAFHSGFVVVHGVPEVLERSRWRVVPPSLGLTGHELRVHLRRAAVMDPVVITTIGGPSP